MEDVQKHPIFNDMAEVFLYASEVKRESLGTNAAVDTYTWPDGGFDFDDADENDNSKDTTENDDYADLPKLKLKTGKKKGKNLKSAVQASAKLRSSVDVFNRILWDASEKKKDYEIGYEDRFQGIKEVCVVSRSRSSKT